MQFITQLGFTSVLATWLSLSALSAQTETATTNNDSAAEQLPEYIVSANTYPVPSNEVGSTVHTLSREDLELGQTTFVLDALRELPGVSVRNNGGPGNGFGMSTRGLNDTPVMLIDGIEVSNPADGRILNPGTLFTNNIERIEFLKGGQSTLYGADAHAGVISIETRKAKKNQSRGTLAASYGSFNTQQGSFEYAINKGNFDFSLSHSIFRNDGFSAKADNTEKDGYKNDSSMVKLGYQASEKLKLYALAYRIDATADYDDGDAKDLQETLLTKTGAQYQANEAWYTTLDFGFTDISGDTGYVWGDSRVDSNRYKLSWANTINLSERWDLAAGVQYEAEDNHAGAGDRDEMSYYADNTCEVTPDLFITLGGRFDDNSAYGQNETWRSSFSYNISAINARLHGSYGSTFKAPTFYQLYNPTYGTADLKAEQGVAWDFGIEQHLLDDRLVCDVTLFGNDITDKIDFVSKYENIASYQSHGLESSVRWIASDKLILQANYSFTRAETGTSTVTPYRVPKHLFNLSANWSTLAGRLQLKPSIQHVAARNDYGEPLPSHTLLNLAGQYALNPQVTVWTRVNNLLNKDYQEIYGYNSADFNITTGVKVVF